MATTSLMLETEPATVSSSWTPEEWDGFVDAAPNSTGCHASRWRRVFETVFGHDCEYLAARRDGRIVGVLPLVKMRSRLFGRFVVSLPFLNDGGLLTADAGAAAALVSAARDVALDFKASHVELRHRGRQAPSLPFRQHKVGMTMALPDSEETLWSSIDRKVRNQVRKAQKSDLEAVSGGAELITEFYAVFSENMRDLGTPVYSPRLFAEIVRQFPERARVFVVRHQGKPVAGSFTLRYRDVLEIPWASSLTAYRQLCPNMLLYWSMMQSAVASGCTTFDFGRSSPDAGTFHFKTQWGAAPEPLHWEYVLLTRAEPPDQGPTNSKFQRAIDAWTRLPLWVTNTVGPHIVRHIP